MRRECRERFLRHRGLASDPDMHRGMPDARALMHAN